MGFSNKLISLRNSNHITQSELAKLLNVTRQSVSKWESNLSLPEISKIVEICNVFNCSLEYLFKDGEQKKNRKSLL